MLSATRTSSRALLRNAGASRSSLLPPAAQRCRCASSTSSGPLTTSEAAAAAGRKDASVRSAAQQLLPPQQLYRRLLRAHRTRLNAEMRSLGDNYIKDEFRRHQNIDNPLQIVGFLGQWKQYLDAMEEQPKQSGTEMGQGAGAGISSVTNKYFEGRKLDPDTMEKVSCGACSHDIANRPSNAEAHVMAQLSTSSNPCAHSYPKSSCTSCTS